MPHSDNPKFQRIIDRTIDGNQEQVFRYWDKLNENQRIELLNQLAVIDFDLMDRLIKSAISPAQESTTYNHMEPDRIISLSERQKRDGDVTEMGESALRAGKVAAFLVAGGQGTRLGFDGPKGMFEVGPVTNRSLFEIHAHKIRAIAEKYETSIPWFIMTSETNDSQTRKFFEQKNYFGLKASEVRFFAQEMIPAIDHFGKFILDGPGHLFMNPNGHGGSLQALYKSGAVDEMLNRGIGHIFYFQVDNVLTRICDPVYLGYHLQVAAEMSNKVVRKISAEEKMGVICKLNRRTGLVEYSDITDEDMRARTSDGELRYWAGSIATHYISTEFVRRLNVNGQKLPYHRAHKFIPSVDAKGDSKRGKKPNGFKFEMFVFDALQFAERSISIEARRSEEYSGLKNGSGSNSPQTVRRDLINEYGRWLTECGVEIKHDSAGNALNQIEIDPLFAWSAESLSQRKFNLDSAKDTIILK